MYETIKDSDSQSGNPSTLFQSFASPCDSNFEMKIHLKMLRFILLHYPTLLGICLNIKTLNHKPKHEVTTWMMGCMEISLN